jgi:drug/metabolite transporter (DMT)-like permease
MQRTQSLFFAAWLRLTPLTRAILWNLLSGILFSVMSVLVKWNGQTLPTMEVVFGRSVFGLIAISPFILMFGVKNVLETSRWRLQIVRSVIGLSAMSCTFYALAKLPLVDVTAIGFSKPIFILFLAAIILKERVRLWQWALTFVGFAGILVILRPMPETFDMNYIFAVLSAVLVAFAITIVKELTESETPFSILAWFSVFSTFMALPFALFYWQEPTTTEWINMVLTGFVGMLAQLCVIRSYALAPASYLAPLGYINIFYTGLFGFDRVRRAGSS